MSWAPSLLFRQSHAESCMASLTTYTLDRLWHIWFVGLSNSSLSGQPETGIALYILQQNWARLGYKCCMSVPRGALCTLSRPQASSLAAQEHEARWFFQQLIIALDYAHRMNVVSRDIKLENTLLDGSRRPLLKICDFGYSKNTEKDSVPKSRVGTPGYTGAP